MRAKQIIELRRVKPFASVDQLTRVRGIAAKRLADIKQEGIACVRKKGERQAGIRLAVWVYGDSRQAVHPLGECTRHIELVSAKEVAAEMGTTEE